MQGHLCLISLRSVLPSHQVLYHLFIGWINRFNIEHQQNTIMSQNRPHIRSLEKHISPNRTNFKSGVSLASHSRAHVSPHFTESTGKIAGKKWHRLEAFYMWKTRRYMHHLRVITATPGSSLFIHPSQASHSPILDFVSKAFLSGLQSQDNFSYLNQFNKMSGCLEYHQFVFWETYHRSRPV